MIKFALMTGIRIKPETPLDDAKKLAMTIVDVTPEVLASTHVKITNATSVERLNQVISEHFKWHNGEEE